MSAPDRRVDDEAARAHFDRALADHAQDFETFFLARVLGLDFEYLPAGVPDANKEFCRVRFPVTPQIAVLTE